MNMLVFEFDNGVRTRIIFETTVLSTFERYRQESSRDKEAGGQLFARLGGRDVIISEATPPKPWDQRRVFSFKPRRFYERVEIWQMYRKGLHYVGDWHTHPQNVPRPSSVDIDSMTDCFNKSGHQLSAFVMVIVGKVEFPRGLSVTLVNAERMQVPSACYEV